MARKKKETLKSEETVQAPVQGQVPEENSQAGLKKDGAWVTHMIGKDGQPVKGMYVLVQRKDGEVRSRPLSRDERDAFFQGITEMPKEDRQKVLSERAEALAATLAEKPAVKEDNEKGRKEPLKDGFRLRVFDTVEEGNREVRVHLIEMVKGGEVSVPKRMDNEMISDFYSAVGGKTKDVRDAKIDEIGRRLFPNGFEPKIKDNAYEIRPVSDAVRQRMENAFLTTGKDGKTRLYATIDGIKKIGVEIKDPKVKDAYFRHFSGLPKDSEERKAAMREAAMSIAADKYSKILAAPARERKNSLGI